MNLIRKIIVSIASILVITNASSSQTKRTRESNEIAFTYDSLSTTIQDQKEQSNILLGRWYIKASTTEKIRIKKVEISFNGSPQPPSDFLDSVSLYCPSEDIEIAKSKATSSGVIRLLGAYPLSPNKDTIIILEMRATIFRSVFIPREYTIKISSLETSRENNLPMRVKYPITEKIRSWKLRVLPLE